MKELNTKSAGYFAYGAAINASITNAKNKSLHSNLNINKAATVRDLLDSAYKYTALYINYRKRFISVTINNASLRDPRIANSILTLFKSNKYDVVKTTHGLIVRIA
jgi:hypothetical protein